MIRACPKRTRKPRVVSEIFLNQDDEPSKDSNNTNSSSMSFLNQEDELVKVSNDIQHLSLSSLDHDNEMQKDVNGMHRSSLKELMNPGNIHEKVDTTLSIQGDKVGGEKKATASEDKNSLALVIKKGEGTTGGKSGGMMNRYVKVLSHLIKAK